MQLLIRATSSPDAFPIAVPGSDFAAVVKALVNRRSRAA